MDKLKVCIQHVMLWEFKNNKNTIETSEKICSVDSQGVITGSQVWNWFTKFNSDDTSLREESRPGRSSDLVRDALRE